MERTITVTGRGAIHVVPDVTRLEVYISGRFETYQAAYDQAKENFAQMVKILEYNNKSGSLAKTIQMDISDFEKSITDKYGHHIRRPGYQRRCYRGMGFSRATEESMKC